jgi:hypothetical protein
LGACAQLSEPCHTFSCRKQPKGSRIAFFYLF